MYITYNYFIFLHYSYTCFSDCPQIALCLAHRNLSVHVNIIKRIVTKKKSAPATSPLDVLTRNLSILFFGMILCHWRRPDFFEKLVEEMTITNNNSQVITCTIVHTVLYLILFLLFLFLTHSCVYGIRKFLLESLESMGSVALV